MNVFGVGAPEIFVVLIVILVLFGPDKLPEIARKVGGISREMRGTLDNLNEQMNNALETSMELDKARMIPPTDSPPPEAKAPQTIEGQVVSDTNPTSVIPPAQTFDVSESPKVSDNEPIPPASPS